MSKVFKPFHTVSEYEKTKISIDKDNTSYVYGNKFSTIYSADLTNGIPKDLVTYNTICFVDDIKEIYRNGLNFSGQGKYSYDPSGSYIEKSIDGYVHDTLCVTNSSTVTEGTTNTSYISGKTISVSGKVSGQAYSGRTQITNNGFDVTTVADLTDANSAYYGYIHAMSISTGGRIDMANYGTFGASKTTPNVSMTVGFKGEGTYGMSVSSYGGSYIVGAGFNFYRVGDTSYKYYGVAPLDDNNQVPTYCLDTFKNTLNYFPYDFKSNNGIWWNLNNKVLTMSNGTDTTTNIQFGYNPDSTTGPFLVFHKNDVETFKLSNDGMEINYFGTTYKLNFNKMIELGIME